MSRSVFCALDIEWSHYVGSPAARHALEGWAADPLLVADGLDEVVERIWVAGRDDADRMLAALARRAPADPIAARVLLQALRPGLRTLCGRFSRGRAGTGVDHDIVAVAWELICTYPIDRRPRSIAANILLDTRKRYVAATFTTDPGVNLEDLAGTSALLVTVASAEDQALETEPAGRQRVRNYLAAAADDGTISPAAAEIVWRTRIKEETDAEVADDLATSVRTLQRRRQRAERCLAAAS